MSVGAVAIQSGVVAKTLGLNPDNLSSLQQFQLANCLYNNDFNLRVVAQHLNYLIKYDFPDADTTKLSEAQIILAGSRYNRGIQQNKQDFIDSINAPEGTPQREYSSYGRRTLEKRKTLNLISAIKE